jgi:hypothetical protein
MMGGSKRSRAECAESGVRSSCKRSIGTWAITSAPPNQHVLSGYDGKGERLGSVYKFMVGKRSGRISYAVMSFGGSLRIGESYHPTHSPGIL